MGRAAVYERVGTGTLAVTVAVLCYDLATSAAGFAPEILTILLIFYMGWGILTGWLPLTELRRRVTKAPLIAAAVGVYLAVDLASATYAPDYYRVWQKYKVVGGLGVIAMGVVAFATDRKRLDRIFLAMGGAAVASALLTAINYRYPLLYPLYYRLRLSPRSDYNVFATALMTGLVCGGCTLIFTQLNISATRRGWGLFGLTVAVLPAIYLSGSRRTYLLIAPVAAVMAFCYLSAGGAYRKGMGIETARRSAFILVLAVACGLGVTGGQWLIASAQARPPGDWAIADAAQAETAPEDRYAAADAAGLFSKRAVIYAVAAEEIGRYDTRQWLVGRGLGANIALYDRDDARIVRAYPDAQRRQGALSAHNMFLADLIDGGLLKAAALLAMVAAVVGGVCGLLWADTRRGIIYAAGLGIALMGCMVSGRFGPLYDRFFVILTAMLMAERGIIRREKAGVDAQHAPQP